MRFNLFWMLRIQFAGIESSGDALYSREGSSLSQGTGIMRLLRGIMTGLRGMAQFIVWLASQARKAMFTIAQQQKREFPLLPVSMPQLNSSKTYIVQVVMMGDPW